MHRRPAARLESPFPRVGRADWFLLGAGLRRAITPHAEKPAAEAMALQRPLPDNALRIVARGQKADPRPRGAT